MSFVDLSSGSEPGWPFVQAFTFFLSESVCLDGCPLSLISRTSLQSCSVSLG